MILTTAAQRRNLIDASKTIAVVGASANETRASFFVFSYLRTRGIFTVTPVNPMVQSISGIPAFPHLQAYAEEHGAPDDRRRLSQTGRGAERRP